MINQMGSVQCSETEGIRGSRMLHPARNHGLHGPHSWHAAWVKLPLYSSPPRGTISCTRHYTKSMHPYFLTNPTLTYILLAPLVLFRYIRLPSLNAVPACPRGGVFGFVHVSCWIRTRVAFVSLSGKNSGIGEHVGSINNFKVFLAVISEPGRPAREINALNRIRSYFGP